MKKLAFALLLTCFAAAGLCGCRKEIDYFDFVSEIRREIYAYEEDGFSLKVYCSDRESPYLSDGIKGKINPVTEIFYSSDAVPDSVSVQIEKHGGEMNYRSTTRSFYLSFSGEGFNRDKISVRLTVDGEEKQIEAANVKYGGVIDGRTALKCVTEYDAELFERLTEGGAFKGEIYVRLIYDGGCFYYVGVCDRAGETHAYLLDGEDGRIIASKEIKG